MARLVAAISRLPGARARRGIQEPHQVRLLLLHLLERALARRLVGPPAQELRAVTKAIAGKMVVADFDHKLRLERLPFGRALRRPAARATRRIAGESRRRDQLLELLGQRW